MYISSFMCILWEFVFCKLKFKIVADRRDEFKETKISFQIINIVLFLIFYTSIRVLDIKFISIYFINFLIYYLMFSYK